MIKTKTVAVKWWSPTRVSVHKINIISNALSPVSTSPSLMLSVNDTTLAHCCCMVLKIKVTFTPMEQ